MARWHLLPGHVPHEGSPPRHQDSPRPPAGTSRGEQTSDTLQLSYLREKKKKPTTQRTKPITDMQEFRVALLTLCFCGGSTHPRLRGPRFVHGVSFPLQTSGPTCIPASPHVSQLRPHSSTHPQSAGPAWAFCVTTSPFTGSCGTLCWRTVVSAVVCALCLCPHFWPSLTPCRPGCRVPVVLALIMWG